MRSEYNKSLDIDHLDEKVFLLQESKSGTPPKLINPFERQGIANKRHTPQKEVPEVQKAGQLMNANKRLNYDLDKLTQNPINLKGSLNEIVN